MTAPHAEQLIAGYLARLADAGAELPREQRNELIEDMRSHIAEARSRESGDETDASVLNILDRLGEPGVVVAEARDRLGVQAIPAYRPGILEIAAVVLLPLIWPIGVILLWISPAWKTRDKLIGTLLPPGGYPALFWLGAAVAVTNGEGVGCSGVGVNGQPIQFSCSGPPAWQMALGTVVAIVLLILPLVTAGYLAVRLRWGRQGAARPA
ncbi:MAG TPA: hypothetical protein VGD57_00945 [Candidatus Dormibacteraeota bacterium]